MNFTDIFVRRPVLASVVSLMILVLGLRAATTLPVLQYPRTQNAVVTVTAIYFGADADVVQGFITAPLENAIAQANGIEDARFVEFEDGGRKSFYATYTAYSGTAIRSELIETSDFISFRMSPLRGAAARNKGMALFPRKIGGNYAMIGWPRLGSLLGSNPMGSSRLRKLSRARFNRLLTVPIGRLRASAISS